jgi:hypothetical protein
VPLPYRLQRVALRRRLEVAERWIDEPFAQQALDKLEHGPADQFPEPPPDYRPPTGPEAIKVLQRGWRDQYATNLKIASAVIEEYDAQHGGAAFAYLQRTGLGREPKLWRLALRTGKAWMKQGWRP